MSQPASTIQHTKYKGLSPDSRIPQAIHSNTLGINEGNGKSNGFSNYSSNPPSTTTTTSNPPPRAKRAHRRTPSANVPYQFNVNINLGQKQAEGEEAPSELGCMYLDKNYLRDINPLGVQKLGSYPNAGTSPEELHHVSRETNVTSGGTQSSHQRSSTTVNSEEDSLFLECNESIGRGGG